jgi:hypothetical protein
MFNFGQKPEQNSFELIPCGDYEVFIEQAEERPTKSGRPQLSIRLKIRDDIQQACQGRILFLNIFQKTPEKLNDMDRQVGNYNYSHLYHLLDVTGILTSGKEFEDMNDICRLLIGKELKVTVHHETYNGKPSEKIDQLKGVHESDPDYQASSSAPLSPAYDAPPAPAVPSGGVQDFEEIISDDDIPF